MYSFTRIYSTEMANFNIQQSLFVLDENTHPDEYFQGRSIVHLMVSKWADELQQLDGQQRAHQRLSFDGLMRHMTLSMGINRDTQIILPNIFIKLSYLISIIGEDNENFNRFIATKSDEKIEILRKLEYEIEYYGDRTLKRSLIAVYYRCNIDVIDFNPMRSTIPLFRKNIQINGNLRNDHFSEYYAMCGPIKIQRDNQEFVGYYCHGLIVKVVIGIDPVILHTDRLGFEGPITIEFIDPIDLRLETPIGNFTYPRNKTELRAIETRINEIIGQLD